MASANGLRRSMSSREMVMKAGKEVTKSVIVAKGVEMGLRRSGIAAAASAAGLAAWGSSLAVARQIHPDYLDPVSSNQVNQDPEYCMNCHLIMTTDEVCKLEDLQKHFEFYVTHFTRFAQRVVVRKLLWPYWELVENMDWSKHIFEVSTKMDHQAMQDYISSSLSEGFDPAYPLWKVTLFSNFILDDGSTGCGILLKFHHCMGDGYSFARTFMTGVEAPSAAPPTPPTSLAQRAHQPGQVGKLFGAASKLLTTKDDPPSVLKAKKLLKATDDRHAVWVTVQATIEEVKRVSKSLDVSVNDVALGALSVALRKFQLMKGQRLADPLSVVWVALRPISEAFEVNDPSLIDNPGNRALGAVLLRLPVELEGSGTDRAKAVFDRISEMKGSPEPLLAQKINGLFGLLPQKLSNPVWDALSNKVSISVSNVPGPKFQMKWAGVTIKNATIWVPPVGTISTFALITSYHDSISLSLGMDASVFSKDDASFITSTFNQELTSMCGSRPTSKL